MPRLIPPELGNGKRPSDPLHSSGGPNDSVPVLDVEEDTHELVGSTHYAALDPDDDDTGLLTGAMVLIDNPRPVSVTSRRVARVAGRRVARAVAGLIGSPDLTRVIVGGSTLWEASTEVIAAYGAHGLDMPEWVASTNPDIASVLAEHFTVGDYSTCKVIPMRET